MDRTWTSGRRRRAVSTTASFAFAKGLIRSVDDPVAAYIHDGGYDSPHNAKITWKNHLQQESEWEGELWGKNANFVGVEEFGSGKRDPREIHDPGTFYEYNDVRINRFALSLARVFGKGLDLAAPAIFERLIGDLCRAELHTDGRSFRPVPRTGGVFCLQRFSYARCRRAQKVADLAAAGAVGAAIEHLHVLGDVIPAKLELEDVIDIARPGARFGTGPEGAFLGTRDARFLRGRLPESFFAPFRPTDFERPQVAEIVGVGALLFQSYFGFRLGGAGRHDGLEDAGFRLRIP